MENLALNPSVNYKAASEGALEMFHSNRGQLLNDINFTYCSIKRTAPLCTLQESIFNDIMMIRIFGRLLEILGTIQSVTLIYVFSFQLWYRRSTVLLPMRSMGVFSQWSILLVASGR